MKKLIFGFVFIFVLSIGLGMAANSEPSVCCEKTDNGAWCVNDVESACDDDFLSAPTSCESTSYCRLGTCYESVEGICMENTPQRVCNDNGGTWDARDIEEVAQCQLGCCIIADQAAFVSLVRCKKLSTYFGVENNYKTDITNEVSCIAEAQAQDIGACVYEKEFERICDFTTRGECGAGLDVEIIDQTNLSLSNKKTFYEDFLCSADVLNTACARQTGTTCYQGDVYWTDSCGNRENVYSSNPIKEYNGRVHEPSEACGDNNGDDLNCGNCDYLLGTRCAEFEGIVGGPADSDHYCQKTECTDRDNNDRINGESWCVYDEGYGNGGDRVGSRYFREVCVDGVVEVEPCADFRNEICLEGSIDIGTSGATFGSAACRVNRWQDCILQKDEGNCLNGDRRDCSWVPSVEGLILGAGGNAQPTLAQRPNICIPNSPPGLEFWKGGNAQQVCGQANARCVVTTTESFLDSRVGIGGSADVDNEECLEETWALDANRVCVALGDCGGYVNYQEAYSGDGYMWVIDGDEHFFSPNSVNIVSGGYTGQIIKIIGRWFE